MKKILICIYLSIHVYQTQTQDNSIRQELQNLYPLIVISADDLIDDEPFCSTFTMTTSNHINIQHLIRQEPNPYTKREQEIFLLSQQLTAQTIQDYYELTPKKTPYQTTKQLLDTTSKGIALGFSLSAGVYLCYMLCKQLAA